MAFYNLSKEDRIKLTSEIKNNIFTGLNKNKLKNKIIYFSNDDTYIRKAAYLSLGKIYFENFELQHKILQNLESLFSEDEPKISQIVINTAGEIGIKDFESVEHFFDSGLIDKDHSVRNAVIGSLKKMSEKNPKPVLKWAKKYLHHTDKEIRREICHGIELRGRTHPQDILPLLKELQNDSVPRVRNTLIHVLGQISYKKNCLMLVIEDLKSWENKDVVNKAIEEIIDVHDRYKNFSALTQKEAIEYIKKYYSGK
ncbi:MAG: HEAT repeat domain-containing protein [Ignavibacteriae bacterium]|nr:MAG: HEAT repeat domain-containing protein [Ignavibacteriota bacterium]